MSAAAVRATRAAHDIANDDAAMRGMPDAAHEALASIARGAVQLRALRVSDDDDATAAIVAQALADRMGDSGRSGRCDVCQRSTVHPDAVRCSRHVDLPA